MGAVLFESSATRRHPHGLRSHAATPRPQRPASLKEAHQEIAALRAGTARRIRIGAGASWERGVLPEAITRFTAAQPGVQIHVLGGVDDAFKALLRTGDLDFVLAAIPDAPQLEPDLEWHPLMADDYCVIAATDYPLHARNGASLPDLLDFAWILPSATTQMMERLRVIFRAHGLAPPEPAIETDVVSLKLELMRNSHYVSLHAAAHLREVDPEQLRPLDIPGASWRRAAGIIRRRRSEPNPAASALIGIIQTPCDRLRAEDPSPSAV